MTEPTTPDPAVNEVCLINIGPAQRAMRMRFGLVCLAIAVAAAVALVVTGAPRLSRLGVALPLLLAGYGVFQAREKT